MDPLLNSQSISSPTGLTTYWDFVVLTVIEILLVAYFLTKDKKHKNKIFWASIYTVILSMLVTAGSLIVSHYKASFYSLILAFLVLPLVTGIIAAVTYFGIILVSFVFSFFTPSKKKPQDETLGWYKPTIIVILGLGVAVKLMLSPHGIADLIWLFVK